jgi:hypothetical protein
MDAGFEDAAARSVAPPKRRLDGTAHRREHTMRNPSLTRGLSWLAVSAIAGLVLVGCSATATSEPSQTAQSSASAAASSPSLTQATPTSTAGPGALTCTPLGDLTPRYTVVVPAGWTAFGGECGFVVAAADVFTAGLSAWIVGQVPTHPCHNNATLTTPGDTVDELVQALVAQELRNATAPVEVTLAGYEGKYLEWSVPTDIVVTDAEYHVRGCDDGNFLSWRGRTGGTRYQQVGGQVDQLWVLDVEGETVVLDATYAPDAPQRVRDELAAIVQTLEFETR